MAAAEGEQGRPLLPEPGREVGPHDAPSPDPRDPAANRRPLATEPGDGGAPEGNPAQPPASEGGHTDAMHLEDDRIRIR